MSNDGLCRNAAGITSSALLDGTATRFYDEPLVENIQYEFSPVPSDP